MEKRKKEKQQEEEKHENLNKKRMKGKKMKKDNIFFLLPSYGKSDQQSIRETEEKDENEDLISGSLRNSKFQFKFKSADFCSDDSEDFLGNSYGFLSNNISKMLNNSENLFLLYVLPFFYFFYSFIIIILITLIFYKNFISQKFLLWYVKLSSRYYLGVRAIGSWTALFIDYCWCVSCKIKWGKNSI